MKQTKVTFGKIFWPAFVAVLVASVVGVILFAFVVGGIIGGLTPKSTPVAVETNSVLHVTLNGSIGEKSSSSIDVGAFNVIQEVGLADILFGLEKAKSDKNIKGIFLELGGISCGYATAKEIREAIIDFEKSGKFVVAYNAGELVGLGKYYISSAASEVYAFPTSTMEFLGLGGELTFYKNTLKKLGVDVEVIRGKNNDFKSAVEPFFLDKMSDSSRLQMETYINNIWLEMRKDIGASRKIDVQELNRYAEDMVIKRMKDAEKYKLIDATKYRDEVISIIKKKVNIADDKDINLVKFDKYARSKFNDDQTVMQAGKGNVAVIVAAGDVAVEGDGLSSTEICGILRKVRADKSIKAVVLRINSPGGSALASDEIWREVKLTNEVKKVTVSMGDLAASGGYYIATPADYIFAEPTTITGSIGVFGMLPYLGGFMQDKLGLSFDYVKTNKHAAFSLNRKLTKEELENIQTEVDAIYMDFLERVAEGRKMTVEQANVIARGRVWTGTDALRIGLVDQLGGIKDAISYAAKKAQIKDPKVIYYPLVEETTMDLLLEQIEEMDNKNSKAVNGAMSKELMNHYQKVKQLESIQGIQMRMPYVIEFK